MKKVLISMGFIALALGATAQVKIKDGTVTGSSTTPNTNAILELESNNKGLLYPRVSLTATNAVLPGRTMVAGMVVYNTATAGSGATAVTPGFYYSNGTVWVRLIDAPATSSAWSLTGNAGTTAGTNFIGTTDAQDVVFKRGNAQAGWLNGSNTAFGVSTMPTTTTGTQNTAVGSNALTALTSGSINTGIGFNALPVNTSGSWNTAVGTVALQNNQSGNYNTAVGLWALSQNTAGNNNTAFGTSALRNITGATDSNNVALGFQAGSTQTAGVNNIAIGANANLPNITGNYQLNIGNTIFGTGVDSTVAGKIGIGNASPAARLTINSVSVGGSVPALQLKSPFSGAATDSLLTWNPADSTVRKIPSSAAVSSSAWSLTGNAGTTPGTNFIGTTDNQDVVFKRNNVRAGWLNASGNTAFGVNTMPTTATGINNTAVGTSALANNGTTGYRNTAFGVAALLNNTTGNNNTAIGVSSLQSLVGNDSNNTALGNGAGFNLTAGNYNTAIGANTSLPNPTGNYQLNISSAIYGIGVDSSVLQPASKIMINTTAPATVASTTSGSTAAQQLATFTVNGGDAFINGITVGIGGGQILNNVAVGRNTLYNNTTATNNTAIGYAALFNNTEGINNVALGSLSLNSNKTGALNTAIGTQAFYNLAGNDSNNTALGNYVGFNQTAGKANTLIGAQAGQIQTAGNNNIALGYNTNFSNLTGNYQLNIGNAIWGTGVDSTTINAANIGINTIAPNSSFQVNGSVSNTIITPTASYTLTATDYTVVFRIGTGLTATLPSPTNIGGRIYRIVNQSGGALTINTTSGSTVTFLSSLSTGSLAVGASATFQSDNGTILHSVIN